MRSWARRSLAAATSFMARVIFCVDWTERIRRWMSRRVAMLGGLDPLGRHELGLGLGHGLGERLSQGVADLPLVLHLGDDLRLLPLDEAVEELLERPHGLHRQVVEQAL